MDVVDGLYAGYGDGPPRGEAVYQARALALGAEYFDVEFPDLDRIERGYHPVTCHLFLPRRVRVGST